MKMLNGESITREVLGESTNAKLAVTAHARAVAEAVRTVPLLQSLGISVNERTHRAPCVLHSGSNPTAFSWHENGRWHCFSCLAGGDKITLVRAVKKCSFREAVEFLAALAGVEYRPYRISAFEGKRARLKRGRTERAARALLDAKFSVWREARDDLHSLVALRRNAAARIQAIEAGAPPRFPGEVELAWQALEMVAKELPRADAGYCIVSFAAPPERYAFVLHPERREEMIETALERGYVANEKNYRFEIAI